MNLEALAPYIVAFLAVVAGIAGYALGNRKVPVVVTPLPLPVPDPVITEKIEEQKAEAVEEAEHVHTIELEKIEQQAADRTPLVDDADKLNDFLKDVGNRARGS